MTPAPSPIATPLTDALRAAWAEADAVYERRMAELQAQHAAWFRGPLAELIAETRTLGVLADVSERVAVAERGAR